MFVFVPGMGRNARVGNSSPVSARAAVHSTTASNPRESLRLGGPPTLSMSAPRNRISPSPDWSSVGTSAMLPDVAPAPDGSGTILRFMAEIPAWTSAHRISGTQDGRPSNGALPSSPERLCSSTFKVPVWRTMYGAGGAGGGAGGGGGAAGGGGQAGQ